METNRIRASLENEREAGKQLMFSPDSTSEEKNRGFALLWSACKRGDPEARFIIGKLLFDGKLSVKEGDRQSAGLNYIRLAANKEYMPARSFLSAWCMKNYRDAFPAAETENGPLTDFEGNRIVIHRTGNLVPVDAVLEYTAEGKNILTFSLNLSILDEGADVADPAALKKAVIDGIRMWEGHYTVFGGQQLEIKINITEEERLFDNVVIVLMAGKMLRYVNKALSFRHSEAAARTKAAIRDKRSQATMGIKKWTVRSRKNILLHSQTGRFDDYDEITHVIKHEFGHVLGLGDLYQESEAGLPGVPAGSYSELDCFIVTDQLYNLVMCDHHGIISNNDVEMVVLAFSENRMQQYQPSKRIKTISKALGRGN